jgi:hypothetical protein
MIIGGLQTVFVIILVEKVTNLRGFGLFNCN